MVGSPAAYKCCILSLLLLSIPARSLSEVLPQGQIPDKDVLVIGVLDLNANNVNEGETAAVTARLRVHLGRQGIFQVIERQKLTDMMTEMGFQVSGVCNTDECIVEVGKILGVNKMVAGSVSRVGRLYSLQVRIIDVSTSTIEHYALRDVSGIEELFTIATQAVARELAQKISSQISTLDLPKSAQPLIPTTGQLQLLTEPEGAEILINNLQYGPTPLTLSLAIGRHELVLAKYEYLAHIDSIDVVGGESQTIRIELDPVPTGLIEVQAQVIGASVFVDNKERGKTPLAGALRLPQGYHIVELQMSGTPIETKQVFVADTTSTVVFKSVALPQREPALLKTGQIRVLSEPEGATILIDNMQYGSTPATLSLKAGRHELVLALYEYLAHVDSIDVVGGDTQTINAELIPVPTGLLEVQAQVIGASIFVDNKERGKTPLAEPLRLPQGYHIVELMMGGNPIEIKQVLVADTTSTVVFEAVAPLQPVAPSTPSTGQIHVLTEPAGAEILIDNVQYGATPATHSLTAGRYEIALALNGYFAHVDSITIVAGELQTVQFDLVPVPTGFLEIRSRTEGATVIVDREERGKTPLAEPLTLTQGYHVVELRKSGYKTETREVFIQGGSTLTLTINLTIPPSSFGGCLQCTQFG